MLIHVQQRSCYSCDSRVKQHQTKKNITALNVNFSFAPTRKLTTLKQGILEVSSYSNQRPEEATSDIYSHTPNKILKLSQSNSLHSGCRPTQHLPSRVPLFIQGVTPHQPHYLHKKIADKHYTLWWSLTTKAWKYHLIQNSDSRRSNINMIPVTEGNLTMEISKKKQCINKSILF